MGVICRESLGFPNDGLSRLMTTYWSERRNAFVSPYTRRDRPRPSEIVVPATRYRGEDLTQELAYIIGGYQPSIIIVTRKEDQHPDHCAAWYFLMDAVGGDISAHDREMEEIRWFSVDEALRVAAYSSERDTIRRAGEALAAGT